MKVFVIDAADGMTEKLEGENDFIDVLKGLALPIDIVHGKLFDSIYNTIKESGFNNVELPEDAQPDYIVMITEGVPVVKVMTLNDIQSIFVGEILGNCVDRFMAHNMNTFIDRIKMWANVIERGNSFRQSTSEYHDTSAFESDFKALTEIKTICEVLANKIGKLQENITLGYK